MASLELAKRKRNPEESPLKRHKILGPSTSQFIELQVPQDTFQRLQRLFPHKEESDIASVVKEANGDFDRCLLLLQKQTLNNQLRSKLKSCAGVLVEHLMRITSIEEGEKLVRQFLENFFVEMHDSVIQSMLSENEVLKKQIQTLQEDSSILKRAFLKLLKRKEQEKQIMDLNEELRQERIKIYLLQRKLAEIYNYNPIDPSRELC